MIRKATTKDLKEISALICKVLEEKEAEFYTDEVIKAWQRHNMLQNLERESENTEIIVYEEERIVGVGSLYEEHIRKLYVHQQCQGRGIGKELMAELERIAASEGYQKCTLNSTINAIGFYRKLGYEEVGSVVKEEDGVSVEFMSLEKEL